MKLAFNGHGGNVKCVTFVGENGRHFVSGSSDKTLRFWETETGKCLGIMVGHKSRVWDVAAPPNGSFVVSASGDGKIKLWNTTDFTNLDLPLAPQNTLLQSVARAFSFGISESSVSPLSTSGKNPASLFSDQAYLVDDMEEMSGEVKKVTSEATLTGHQGDVYAVAAHPSGTMVSSGGYDMTVRLYDIKTQKVCRILMGHTSSVCSTIFNPIGNLIITGSKDNSIKFWDVISGACIKTFNYHLGGEVTSVEMNSSGSLLLSSSRDNSNRVWDIRSAKPLVRLKGHQNTSKNFIKSSFGPSQQLIVGGSEDGCIYLWDVNNGNLVQKLRAHHGIVYNVRWNPVSELLLSCSHDKTVKTWWYDSSQEKANSLSSKWVS